MAGKKFDDSLQIHYTSEIAIEAKVYFSKWNLACNLQKFFPTKFPSIQHIHVPKMTRATKIATQKKQPISILRDEKCL